MQHQALELLCEADRMITREIAEHCFTENNFCETDQIILTTQYDISQAIINLIAYLNSNGGKDNA